MWHLDISMVLSFIFQLIDPSFFFFVSLFQGTPLKYDTNTSTNTKKHDVRSIIGSPGRNFHPMHPMEAMQDPRTLERAYEDNLKNRPSPVTNSGGSITRGSPMIMPEPGKPRHSPLAYEDHQTAHGAAFGGHLHRGSPISTREAAPRQLEGQPSCFFSGTLCRSSMLPSCRTRGAFYRKTSETLMFLAVFQAQHGNFQESWACF